MFSIYKKLKEEKTVNEEVSANKEISAEEKVAICKSNLKKNLKKQDVNILTLEQSDFILIKFHKSMNGIKFHDKKRAISAVLKDQYGEFFVKNFKTGFDKSNFPIATYFIPVDELYSVISTGKKLDAEQQENSEQDSDKERIEYQM